MKDYKVIISIVATLLCVVALLFFVPGFEYRLVYIPTSSYCRDTLMCNIDSTTTLNVALDNIIEQKCNMLSELEMIKRLEDRKLIVSPNEYTSRISSYYSVLVAFLVGLFVLFTILSYFSIKSSFSKELENEKQKVSADVKEYIRNLLVDSCEIRNIISESLRGNITDDVLQALKDGAEKPEGIKDVNLILEKFRKDIDTLFATMVELEQDVASKNNIN